MRAWTGRQAAAVVALLAAAGGGAACGARSGFDVPVTDVREGPSGLEPADAAYDVFRAPPPNADCAEAGLTYIYVIGEDNNLYSFYPSAGEFTVIGTIACNDPKIDALPFSMAVDHRGVAYVEFDDGLLYRVSTRTAECEPTPFVTGQHGFTTFCMGFVANTPDGGASGSSGETLYVAASDIDALGTINVDTFVLDVVAPLGMTGGMSVGMAELTGTGGGNLYGFFAPTNIMAPSFIVQINPQTAAVESTVMLPGVMEGAGWAFGFWGGDFYTFTAPDGATSVVTRYRPSDASIVPVAMAPAGVIIVGAGVSTCAPQE